MHRSPNTTAFYHGRLPHWEVEEGRYFITLRQAGSLPAAAVQRLHQAISKAKSQASDPHDRRHVLLEMENWLDQAKGPHDLTRPEIAQMLMEAIAFREQENHWKMIEYVIMPNHLHLFCMFGSTSLFDVLTSFKRWTGRKALAMLHRPSTGFWHREWFDHWSRSPDEDERIAAYIRANPVTAGLVEAYNEWPYASWAEQ